MSASVEHRVLLRMQEGEDRRRLGEWLADESGYLPVMAESDDVLSSEFDICIVDVPTLENAGPDVLARKRTEPTFLPCLLLVPERFDDPEQALSPLAEDVRDAVDETLRAPIRAEALERRLEALLRTRDLSERLQRSRDRYHGLLEALPEAVFVLRGGEIDFVNEAGMELLGRRELDVVGNSLLEFVADRDRQAVARNLRRLRSGADGRVFDGVALRTAAGATVPVEIAGVRLFDERNERIVPLIARDVRRRDQRERQLAVLDRVLRHGVGARTAAVLEHAQAIGERVEDPTTEDRVEGIRDAAHDLLELSDDARRFRTLLRQHSSDDAARDLAAVVGETVAAVSDEHEAVDVELTLTDSAPVAPREAAELAIDELLDDALADAETDLRVVTDSTETLATVRLTSTGDGVPLSERSPLEGEAPKPSGSVDALGLWLVRWSIEEAGGSVEIDGGDVVLRLLRDDVDHETPEPGNGLD